MPLSPGGLFLLGAGLFLLFRGFADRNPYEIVLAALALSVLALLAAMGILSARALAGAMPVWTAPAPVSAGESGEAHRAAGPETRLPYFFRMHMSIRGELGLGGGRRIGISEEFMLDEPGTGEFRLRFPLSGVFHASGRLVLRDVFGLFRLPFGAEVHRSIPVLPAPHRRKPRLRIDALSGSEDKQNRRNADEERYHMREYAPGDRYRDINWKTSGRLAALVTRISPFTQEKTRTVQVDFRNYGPASLPPLSSLWLLDRAKARLLVFLRTLHEEHPEYRFKVRTAGDETEIQTDEEMEAFAAALAGASFAAASNSGAGPGPESSGGELYVFSTACDLGLPAFLGLRAEKPTRLYITFPAGRRGESAPDAEVFEARSLLRIGGPSALGFLAGRSGRELASVPRPLRGEVDVSYAGVLP